MDRKRYIRLHVDMLLIALAFFVYAMLIRRISPDGLPHCILHDVLRLYCPFCGGTRTFLSLLRLDLVTAIRSNIAVLIAAIVAIVLDLRAFVLLCRKSEAPLLPRGAWRAPIFFFLAYALTRNTALLLGIDSLGELAPFWSPFPVWRALLFLLLGAGASVCFLIAVSLLHAPPLLRRVAAFLAPVLLLTLALVLYGIPWIALGYILIGMAAILYCIRRKRTLQK